MKWRRSLIVFNGVPPFNRLGAHTTISSGRNNGTTCRPGVVAAAETNGDIHILAREID